MGKAMTRQQLAEKLNGCQRRSEISKELAAEAKANNLVVLYGASDDNLEAEGAIYDELSAYGGGRYHLAKKGELYSDAEEENTYHKAEDDMILPLSEEYPEPEGVRLIALVWIAGAHTEKCWNLTTTLPHSEFIVNDGDEPFSDGIVIDLDEIE